MCVCVFVSVFIVMRARAHTHTHTHTHTHLACSVSARRLSVSANISRCSMPRPCLHLFKGLGFGVWVREHGKCTGRTSKAFVFVCAQQRDLNSLAPDSCTAQN